MQLDARVYASGCSDADASGTRRRGASGEAVTAGWWQRFGNTELDELIAQSLAANHDLAAAVSRIDQARASSKIARSALAPTAGASTSASRDRRETKQHACVGKHEHAGAAVGQLRARSVGRQRRHPRMQRMRGWTATVYDRDTIELVLQSDVAANYFQILALKDRLAISRKNLDAAQQLMTLVQVRADNGAATALDVAQQRTTLLNIQAEIPALEQASGQTQTALAVCSAGAAGIRSSRPIACRGQAARCRCRSTRDAARAASRHPRQRSALVAANADIGAARAHSIRTSSCRRRRVSKAS